MRSISSQVLFRIVAICIWVCERQTLPGCLVRLRRGWNGWRLRGRALTSERLRYFGPALCGGAANTSCNGGQRTSSRVRASWAQRLMRVPERSAQNKPRPSLSFYILEPGLHDGAAQRKYTLHSKRSVWEIDIFMSLTYLFFVNMKLWKKYCSCAQFIKIWYNREKK